MARPIKVNDPHSFLLNSAKEILINNGSKELTARNLSKSSGYATGSMYKYFGNIDDLILQINADTINNLRTRLEAINNNGEKASKGKLTDICQAYFEFAAENAQLWNSVMNYQPNGSEKSYAVYREKLEQLNNLIETIVSPHVGWLQSKRDMAAVLWAGIQGIWFTTLRTGTENGQEKEAKKLVEILVKNLFK